MPRRKPFASYERQVERLRKRKLILPSDEDCIAFLEKNHYYRFSGYARYFQIDPANNVEEFQQGVSFKFIANILDHDETVRSFLLENLAKIEVKLRAVYAQHEAEIFGPYDHYLDDSSYLKSNSYDNAAETIVSELRRSKDPFIECHRKGTSGPDWVSEVPIWAAVEVMSFGTISKALEYQSDTEKQLLNAVALTFNVKRDLFCSQLRSFAYLRNRCAHHSRIWMHHPIDRPALPRGVKKRASRNYEKFDESSLFPTILAIGYVLENSGLNSSFMQEFLAICDQVECYREGILIPPHN